MHVDKDSNAILGGVSDDEAGNVIANEDAHCSRFALRQGRAKRSIHAYMDLPLCMRRTASIVGATAPHLLDVAGVPGGRIRVSG